MGYSLDKLIHPWNDTFSTMFDRRRNEIRILRERFRLLARCAGCHAAVPLDDTTQAQRVFLLFSVFRMVVGLSLSQLAVSQPHNKVTLLQ